MSNHILNLLTPNCQNNYATVHTVTS